MGAVTYPNERVAEFIEQHLVPIQVMYDAKPLASDFNVKWTPTIITLDEEGKEHHRIVGFLPPEEFIPALMLGIAKVHFDGNRFSEAMAMLDRLLNEYAQSNAAPEGVYLRGVAEYKSTHQAQPLKRAYERLKKSYPGSEWVKRAEPYSLL